MGVDRSLKQTESEVGWLRLSNVSDGMEGREGRSFSRRPAGGPRIG